VTLVLIDLPNSGTEPSPPIDPPRRRDPDSVPTSNETPGWHHVSRRSVWTGHFILGLLTAFTVLPIAWMYLTSFRPPNDLFSSGLISTSVSGANYSTAVHAIPVAELLWHTVFVSIGVAAGQLITSVLAAYAFARFRFRGRNLLFLICIGSWLVPFQVTMLPNYVLVSRLGLLNSLVGIIVPQLSSAFAILLLRQHMNGFPTELLEAARVEGQSSWATLWTVVIPNLMPALAALGILLFVNAWNEYFWPLLVYRNPNSVIQLGIQGFLNSETVNYGALMAASGLATLPIFAIYALLQRRVVSAFVRSGLR
jgi:ABC-type glycerol-3-phosphate transport system permease component